MKFGQISYKILALVFTIILFPALIWWVGIGHVGPLFEGEFTQHLGSIEVSYIQMAKFIKSSIPHFAWQPRWYLGYPMTIIYTPLVPFFEFLANSLIGWSFGHAYRWLTAFSYVAGLVTLYLFARTLFNNSVAGVLTALSYGILPSVIAHLFDEVASDSFALELVDPRRFTILVRWGEGPHIVSLLFLPLAALFWVAFLRKGDKWSVILGAFFSSLVVLTNSVGTWALLILIFSITVGEIVENYGDWLVKIKRTLILGLLSYGFSAFWFNPLFISSFFKEGGGTLSYWLSQFPWGWLLLVGAFIIYFLLSKKLLTKIPGASASLLFFMIMFGLVYTYYNSGSERLELVPQVLRLNTEVDIASSLIIGLAVSTLGLILSKKNQLFFSSGMAIIFVLAMLWYWPRQSQLVQELPKHTKSLESVGKNLTQTPEYEVANNLEDKVTGDERVFVPGNYAFYLNYFTDLPQLRGALFQSSIHPWPDHIYYQATVGKDADITLAWLKISNIGWFVLNGPREIFGDFEVGVEKFDQILEQVDESQGDRFYKVPLKDNSLAKAVPQDILEVKKPFNAIDKEPIFSYVKYLEASDNQLDFKEKANGVYQISGNTSNGEVVLVQQAYAPGWKAKDGRDKSLEVKKDPLGFVIIKPRQSGIQDITLRYTTNWRIWFGRLLTLGTIVISVVILIKTKEPLIKKSHVKKETENQDEG